MAHILIDVPAEATEQSERFGALVGQRQATLARPAQQQLIRHQTAHRVPHPSMPAPQRCRDLALRRTDPQPADITTHEVEHEEPEARHRRIELQLVRR